MTDVFPYVNCAICYACVLCQEPPETLRHLLLRSEGDCGFGWIVMSHSTAWSERASVLAFYLMRPCGSIQRRSKGNCVCWTGLASMLSGEMTNAIFNLCLEAFLSHKKPNVYQMSTSVTISSLFFNIECYERK